MVFFVRDYVIPALIAIAAAAYIGINLWMGFVATARAEAESAAQEAAFTLKKATITGALADIDGISLGDIRDGFWISYPDETGAENLYFVDTDTLVRLDISEEKITELIAKVRTSHIIKKDSIVDVSDADLPDALRFHNALYAAPVVGSSTLALKAGLEQKRATGRATSRELANLSYLKELEGDYASRDALDAQNCRTNGERCAHQVSITVSGRVVDAAGEGTQGASVSIVSRPGASSVVTDEHGFYSMSLSVTPIEKIRIRAIKRNFSDGFADAIVLDTPSKRSYQIPDIQIMSPINIVTVDFVHRTVTGGENTFDASNLITIHTSHSTYEIPSGSIVHKDGTPYAGNTVDVYLYEFSQGEPPESLMQVDTFDQVMGYAGNLMKTFGMPYIQFFASSGEELHVLSSHPMKLRYQIADMEALRTNAAKIYRELSEQDMEMLVSDSRAGGYPIDRQYLIEHDMLQFPAFWVFDRKRGIWDNIGISVRNTQGLIESPFYTIKDSL